MKKLILSMMCVFLFMPQLAMAKDPYLAPEKYVDIMKKAKCVLTINGHTYMNSLCEIHVVDTLGSFYVEAIPKQPSQHFAYMSIGDDGKLHGSWNKDPHNPHAYDDLGILTRHGACWKNKHARICTYNLKDNKH